jgi:hypothetical protein
MDDGCIFVEPNKYYYYDLRPKTTKSSVIVNNSNEYSKYKYCLIVKDKLNNSTKYVRMLSDCSLKLEE